MFDFLRDPETGFAAGSLATLLLLTVGRFFTCSKWWHDRRHHSYRRMVCDHCHQPTTVSGDVKDNER